MLLVYYGQIALGNNDPVLLKDYAVVESLVAGVDPQLIVNTIERESQFYYKAINENDMAIGCDSKGLVQIRDCNHPTVTDEMAYNPIFAVNFLIKNINKCETWWKGTCGVYKKLQSKNELKEKSLVVDI